jgi:AraC-like DNA-binding protein
MKILGFKSFPDNVRGLNSCNRVDISRPIVVNCAGRVSTKFSFTTDNPDGRDDYYFMAVTEGELLVLDASQTVKAGDMMIFPPNTHYRYTFSGEGELCYYWVHFTGSYVEQFLGEIGFEKFPCIHRNVSAEKLASSFGRLFDIYLQGGTFRDLSLSSQLERILISAMDTRDEDKINAKNLLRSISYMHSKYNSDIRVPMLAQMENLSVSRYNAVFNSVMGISPQRYLINLRLQNACELLKNTDMNVNQIGVLVGYDDPHFFSKIFKRYIGISPNSYRHCKEFDLN